MWTQLNKSGFFFRIINGKCRQAACILVDDRCEAMEWVLFNPKEGNAIYQRKKEMFAPVTDREYLDVLDTLPHYQDDTKAFLLSIVSE